MVDGLNVPTLSLVDLCSVFIFFFLFTAIHKVHEQPSTHNMEISEAMDRYPVSKPDSPLPPDFSYVCGDPEGVTTTGVVAQRVVAPGEVYGPYTGALLDEVVGRKVDSSWEICVRGRVMHYIDAKQDPHNWMVHIGFACTREEQNMEAFQSYGDIYFRTLNLIQPGEELKVFYSDEYLERIGCQEGLENLFYDQDADRFDCIRCPARCKTSKSMLRHMKFTHNQVSECQTPTDMVQEDNAFSKVNDILCISSSSSDLLGLVHPNRNDGAITVPGKPLSQGSQISEKIQISSSPIQRTPNASKTKTSSDRVLGQEGPESNYVCRTCGKVFHTQGRLNAHRLFHATVQEGFTCDTCGLVVKSNQILTRHQKTHVELSYKCVVCKEQYSHLSNWTRHSRVIHGIQVRGVYRICVFCNKHFMKELDVVAHQTVCKEVDGDLKGALKRERKKRRFNKRYPLNECGVTDSAALPSLMKENEDKKNPSRKTGREHVSISQGDEKQYESEKEENGWLGITDSDEDNGKSLEDQSDEDERAFRGKRYEQVSQGVLVIKVQPSTEQDIEDPVDMIGCQTEYFAKPRPFKCKFCPKTFLKRAYALSHVKLRHTNKSKYQCSVCHKNFETKNRYTIHMRKHSNDRPYKCQLCPRTFSSESALNNHQVEHTDAKPFRCEPCNKGFRLKSLLQNHIGRIHRPPELSHKCNLCGKGFATLYSLSLHERRHMGYRPHVCEYCGKGFTSKHSLQCHHRLHTGERPFKCKDCGKSFTVNHHLDEHRLSMHSGQ
ncbi:LOW QUALITY PROTEIN: uncharacterized protein [Diadema setosum]|uniref:LOW QUALITY PROTEIN: uncharacterized protein n=1 Tax=Diadema setosum TaxID=31175 RepID=UPI003B3A3724